MVLSLPGVELGQAAIACGTLSGAWSRHERQSYGRATLTATLQIDATVPTPVAIVASATGITDPITSELAGVLPS